MSVSPQIPHKAAPPRVLPRAAGEIAELIRLRAAVAKLVVQDPVYAPIFERLEFEIASLEASDPVARARALIAGQKAMA